MIVLLAAAAVAAFALQFLDASVGQGYGVMTPLLLLLGFPPLEVVLAVLATSAVLSTITGVMHHQAGNVDFGLDSKSLKVVALLVGMGLVGVSAGALVAGELPKAMLEAYISGVIIIIGARLLTTGRKEYVFSWAKMGLLGALAAFNKGITGGGYGPVLAGGQIIAGVKSRKAVGITAMAEGATCIAGVAVYVALNGHGLLNLPLTASLLAGGLIATPAAVHTVRTLDHGKLRKAVAAASIVAGTMMLAKLVLENAV